ncbi:MAG: hypothetical protein DRJ03_05260 [Chloroflexi bacterium]|nr:MAG: hypothetical protein DRJ03_05260 [Chloroflexota bacterium]
MRLRLSISQIQTFLRCQRMWALRYVEGLKIPPPGAALIGSLTERALEVALQPVLEGKRPEPLDVVEDVFAEGFKEARDLADWRDDKPEKLFEDARVALRGYHKKQVPKLRPVALQERRSKFVAPAGMEVVGIADLREAAKIVDWKTSKRKVSTQRSRAYAVQLHTYQALWPQSEGLELHNLVLGREEPLILPVEAEEDPERVWALFWQVKTGIEIALRTGVFLPASLDHWICSPKWCGFWDVCQSRDWRPEAWLEAHEDLDLGSLGAQDLEEEEVEWL